MAGEADAFILLVLAFIFPPAAVAMLAGCGPDLCINFLLTLLGWLPGCIHAFWLVLKRSEANETYGYKNWTYSGMGEYRGRDGDKGANAPYSQPPAPPPSGPPPPQGQYPATTAPPPPQAPVDQKETAPPAPVEMKSGATPATDQGLAPSDQKYSDSQAPPQPPTDQKQTESSAPGGGA